MSPFDVFDPSAALDPTRYAGQAGAARLLQAAQHFPGGPVVLVLALFFAPVGPGIPAGVLPAPTRRARARSTPGIGHRQGVSARDSATRESCAHPESHFTAENAAGASNWLLMFSTSWPSFSVLATTATHSGSARKAPQRFSRSAMLSQASM